MSQYLLGSEYFSSGMVRENPPLAILQSHDRLGRNVLGRSFQPAITNLVISPEAGLLPLESFVASRQADFGAAMNRKRHVHRFGPVLRAKAEREEGR